MDTGLNYCRAMTQEPAELTAGVPWKWRAKHQKFDARNARVEVDDDVLPHTLKRLPSIVSGRKAVTP